MARDESTVATSAAAMAADPRPLNVQSVTFTPDGNHLLVSLKEKGLPGLFVISLTGRVVRRLTRPNSGDWDAQPAYSRDGSMVAFAGRRGTPHPGLFVMKADGTDLRRLTDGQLPDLGPCFSPDGSRIYFRRSGVKSAHSPLVSPHWHHDALMCIDLDGSRLERLAYFYSMSEPQVAPDGRTAILANRGKLKRVYLVPPNKGLVEPIELDVRHVQEHLKTRKDGQEWYDDFRYYHPTLSPDGLRLAFQWMYPYKHNEAYVAELATGRFEQITRLCSGFSSLAFSPDGSRVACALRYGTNYLRESRLRFDDDFSGYRVERPDRYTKIVTKDGVKTRVGSNNESYEVHQGVSNLWLVDFDDHEINVPVDAVGIAELVHEDLP